MLEQTAPPAPIAVAPDRAPAAALPPRTVVWGASANGQAGLAAESNSSLPEQIFGGGPSAAAPVTQPDERRIENLELVLFALEVDHAPLSDSLGAYGDPSDPLIPVSELAQMLGLDLEVRPVERTITGRIGEARRALTVDLDHDVARIAGTSVPLTKDSAALSVTEIYLKASVLQMLLPVAFKIDSDDYRIELTSREKLPYQARAERAQRLYGLGDVTAPAEATMKVEAPYRWFGRPAFDFSADLGNDSVRGGAITRLEGRVAADLLKTSFTGFFATDDRGNPASARMQFVRRAPEGGLLGPLSITYAAAGDVYTPTMTIGARSFGGAGAVFSTARADETNVFQRIDLRGELPIGYDVELYINDVLFGGQPSPIRGRYEFANVPLVRGTNIIRVVAYGPHGERQEHTRVLNVGGGQLPAGRTVVDAGIVRQDAPLIEFKDGQIVDSGLAKGKLRFVSNVAHGLTSGLTVAAGLGIFSDRAGNSHQTVTAGLRGSLLRTAMQLDYAKDFAGGSAVQLGAAGRLAGVSFTARHAEYSGSFVDETNTFFDLSRPLKRHSQVLFDLSLPFFGRQRLPLSGNFERSEFADGGTTQSARMRTTLSVADTLVALGADYSRRTGPGFIDKRMTGSIAVSRLIDYKWQVRAAAEYDVVPTAKLRTASVTVDREISRNAGFRLGVGQAYGVRTDTSVQAAVFAHMPFGEMSLNGDYASEQHRWRVGLQLRFGLAYDPAKGGYRMTPPGPASGGSASFQAFTDNDGDGQMGPDDTPVAGIAIQGGGRTVTTDKHGRAFVTGLGDSQQAILRTDTSGVDTLFAALPPQSISFVPRAGGVVKLPYALVPTSEVDVKLSFRRPDGSKVGLSAVKLRLVPDKGEALTGTSEFDGSAVFESVRPGRYTLQLDPDQVRRLGIALAAPVEIKVDAKGAQIVINAEIVLTAGAKQ